MALSTLAELRIEAGLTASDTALDAALTHYLRRSNDLIRDYTHRFFGGLISDISQANPAVVTSIGHGLTTGDTIVVTGSDSDPVVNGSHVVTVIDQDTFSVPVAVTTAGTTGFYGLQKVAYLSGRDSDTVTVPFVPVRLSGLSVWLNASGRFGAGDFGADELLTIDDDYFLEITDELGGAGISSTGRIFKTGGVWAGQQRRRGGRLHSSASSGRGNVKVQYVTGSLSIPGGVRAAAESLTKTMVGMAGKKGPLSSENIEDYSYSILSAADEIKALHSVTGMLRSHRTWLIGGG